MAEFEGVSAMNDLLSLQHKVSDLENQLAENIHTHREETSSLQNQLAHLNTQLEQSHTDKQKLEYDLTLAHKTSRQVKVEYTEKAKEWSDDKSSMQDRIAKLTRQCREWQSTLDTVQQARGKEQTIHKQQLTEKEEELVFKCSQYEELVAAKEQLDMQLSTEQSLVAELQNRQHQLKTEVSSKNDLILRLERDLQDATDRERQLQKELQNTIKKATTLQSNLETERSRLQEVHFSSQVSHQRMKELEGQLEEEKNTHWELQRNVECLRETVSGLKNSLKTEERKSEVIKEQLQSKQLECQRHEQQANKHQAVISDLSHQLELCRSNFDSLKEELDLAKERQSLVEKTYTACLREVDSLIDGFQLHLSKAPPSKGHKAAINSTPDPAHLPEKLRLVLTESKSHFDSLKSQLDSTQSLLVSSKKNVKQLSLECSTYREVVTSRTAAMTEAEKQLGASAKELMKLKSDLSSCKAKASQLENELNTLREKEEAERMQLSELKAELHSLERKHSNDNKVHCRFLQLLKDQLSIKRTSTPVSQQQPFTLLEDDCGDPNQPNWKNLSGSLHTLLLAHIEAFRRAKKELKQHKSTIASLKSTLQTTETMHKESVDRLTVCSEEQERQWTQRNEELKSHYERLIVEAENRNQELERRLTQATRHSEEVGSLKRGVEDELRQLKEVHRVYKNDRACLLACTCLLAGSLFPILQKMEQLSRQKSTLLQSLSQYQKLEKQVNHVVNSILALSQESQAESTTSILSEEAPSSLSSLHPQLRFRKAVIVVLAVNRFNHFYRHSTLLFKATLPPFTPISTHCEALPVHLGFVTKADQKRNKNTTIKTTTSLTRSVFSNKDVAGWLRSERVLSQVRESFSQLQPKLDSCAPQQQSKDLKRTSKNVRKFEGEDHKQKSTVILLTRECFSEVLEMMSSHFSAQKSSVFVLQSKGSLCVRLRDGLETVLRKKVHFFISSKELGESLQTQLSNLVSRLHQAQVDLYSTRSQLKQTEKHCEKLTTTCELTSKMKEQVSSLQTELREMVPRVQFEELCQELNASIGREKDTRMSLSQHVSVVQQLQERLQMAGQEVHNKETTLSMASKELHDLRLSLQHKDHQLNLVGKQLKLVEGERMAQAQQVNELQTALARCRREMVDEVFSESFGGSRHSPSSLRNPVQEKNGFVPLREHNMHTESGLLYKQQDGSTQNTERQSKTVTS